MDNFEGDLTDIIRGSGGGAAYGGGGSSCSTVSSSISEAHHSNSFSDHWHFSNSDPMNFPPVMEDPRVNFGDPFSNMRDPFLHQLDILPASAYFNTAANSDELITSGGGIEEAPAFASASASAAATVFPHKALQDDMRRAAGNNIFSNIIQISPNTNPKLPVSPRDSPAVAVSSPRVIKPPPVVTSNMINANSSRDCLADNAGVQISSPRNPGLKRR